MTTRKQLEADAEQAIAKAAIAGLLACGYSISVDDGGALPIKKSHDAAAILAAMFSVDEETLIAYDANGKRAGSVFFVHGNDGWDVIADHSMSLVATLAPAMALAEKLEPAISSAA